MIFYWLVKNSQVKQSLPEGHLSVFTPNKMSMTSQPVTEIDGELASGQTMFSLQEDGHSWVSTLQPLIVCGTNNGGNNVVEYLWKSLVEIKTLLKVKV